MDTSSSPSVDPTVDNPTITSTPASSTPASSTPGVSGTTSSTFNGSSTVTSLADLKQQAPELYNAMIQSIAESICKEMNAHQERLKELMRQGEKDAEGSS